jgi:nucleotide-binding universal stress UspA family protein
MRVLVAVDGSAAAENAVALVDAIAWPVDLVLRVVTVIEPVLLPISGPAYRDATLVPEVDESITGYARDVLRGATGRLRAAGRTVEDGVLRGRAASAIMDDAREFGADLVVAGSRGHGTIESLLLGSVSSEIVDHAHCPVLVARATSLTGVVFATDGSPSAAAAERALSEWSIFGLLPIRVVSVADVVRPWTTGIAPTFYGQVLETYAADLREASAQHEHIAADAAARLQTGGRVADAEVRTGDVATEIIAAVERHRADLVVVGSRGRTGLTRLLLGSVARNVLSGSSASVLIVREGAEKLPDAAAPRG